MELNGQLLGESYVFFEKELQLCSFWNNSLTFEFALSISLTISNNTFCYLLNDVPQCVPVYYYYFCCVIGVINFYGIRDKLSPRPKKTLKGTFLVPLKIFILLVQLVLLLLNMFEANFFRCVISIFSCASLLFSELWNLLLMSLFSLFFLVGRC